MADQLNPDLTAVARTLCCDGECECPSMCDAVIFCKDARRALAADPVRAVALAELSVIEKTFRRNGLIEQADQIAGILARAAAQVANE